MNRYNWKEISENKNITLDCIKNNPDIPWNWEGISKNNNLDIDFIKENLQIINNNLIILSNISKNINITEKDIKNNLEVNWNWENIILRSDISNEFMIDIQENKIIYLHIYHI